MHAPLAQLVEQLTLNQWAAGSSPSRCTKIKSIVLAIDFIFALSTLLRGSRGGKSAESTVHSLQI